MVLPFPLDLTDTVAVVTGGSGVLCGTLAEALALCGAKVAVIGRDKMRCEQKALQIRRAGGVAVGLSADVTQKESLQRAHQRILNELGPCSLLINGAGGNRPLATTVGDRLSPDAFNPAAAHAPADAPAEAGSFLSLDPAEMEAVVRVNFLGSVLAAQEWVPDMIGRKGCTVINIASMNAFTPLTRIPAYSAAKAALANFTQWLAVHLSSVGIRVNAIAPGFFATEQNRSLLFEADGTLSARGKKILAATPMGRFGQPEELVGTLLFLVSEAASGFVNGAVIPVDGAFLAYAGV